ncbi:phage tail tape measure protein [Cedecea sp.]|jgi:TP901 family phage tail tape measure protein|uniref:phage tail tape measure protein n=1 Tax=Cedecea sp. TaxID=1970739 RepID=UPI002F3F7D12
MADSFELKAIITAVDQLTGPMKGMQRELKGFRKEMAGLGLGAAAAGSAILGAIGIATKQAIDFEASMADVRKVVDGLETPAAFRQMQDDILDLTTKIPMAANEMAELIAQAGQSGIDRSELKQFGEDAAKIGVAWDLSGREAGKTLAIWRTAFGLTESAVVELADKVNYLGNTGPASSADIAQVVTELGGVAKSANVASGDVAALASTIIGVGIKGDVASTGIKNFIMGLTSADSARQKAVAKAIGWSPDKLAKGMIKDSRGTMLKVLDAIGKLPEEKRTKAMTWLFGKESSTAVIPLLSNLPQLKANFDKVTNAQLYGGAAANEYAIASDTAANDLKLMGNEVAKLSIEMGREFIPVVRDAVKEVMPFIKQASVFVKQNPELVQSAAKFGAALLGVGVSIGVLSRAVKILNSVVNLSPAKVAIAALAAGAMLIIDNWDDVAPVIKAVWHEVDKVAQAMGGWETVIEGVGLVMAGAFTLKTIGALREAVTLAGSLSGLLGSIARMGAMTITIGVAISLLKQLEDLEKDSKESGMSKGEFLVNKMQGKERERGYNGFLSRLNELTGMYNAYQIPDGRYMPKVPVERSQNRASPQLNTPGTAQQLISPALPLTQRSELKVSFENAPQGMRVVDIPESGNPLMSVSHDVGYSPFRKPR